MHERLDSDRDFDKTHRCPDCAGKGETPVKTYGPYRQRKGMRIFPYKELRFADGSRRTVPCGPSEPVAPASVHIEGEMPLGLIEDLAGAAAYSSELNLSKARIADPIHRFLRLFGLQHHTDEKV